MSKGMICKCSLAAGFVATVFASGLAQAAVTNVEGSAGGGLVPWALMHPQGPLVSYTHVDVNDYKIQSVAIAGTIANMVELSLAKQMVNAPAVGAALGLNNRLDMTTFGVKVKLVDMGKDSAMPQIAIGLQSKSTSGAILDALKTAGAVSSKSGTDWYAAATKFVTIGGKKVVLDGTLRATKANTFGVLGFGGGTINNNNNYKWEPEVSVGVFVADNVVLGGEYRAKPNNIGKAVFGIQEKGAWDIFMAYFVNKNMAITAAYANLGQVGPDRAAVPAMASKQDGLYVQLQANF